MELKTIATADLIPYANNARTHSEEQVQQIAKSIKEFGFINPVIIDRENGIIAGHGRLLAAEILGLVEVPCIMAEHLTETQKKAYIIADNQLATNAGWDNDLLKIELTSLKEIDFDIDLLGFDDAEIQNILGTDDNDPETIEEDNFDEEIEIDPITETGQIWQLGDHRMMVGDSTNQEDVDRLMDGAVADLVITDPPYNVNYEGGTGLKIQNDNMEDKEFREFLKNAFSTVNNVLKPGGVFYIWHADSEGYNFRGACHDVNWKVRQCLIWNKNSLVLGRQDYHWKHEPCLYGWKEGAGHYFIDDRSQTTVIEDKAIDFKKLKKDEAIKMLQDIFSDKISTTVINEDKPAKNGEHPTMKPLNLLARAIKNSSKPLNLVIDFFGGSGSTLMACEQLGRKCNTMELDPHYADVIITRWEMFTGKKAVLMEDNNDRESKS